MKKFLVMLVLLVIILPSTGGAETAEPVKVAALAGTTGLAMVRLMEQPAIGGYPCNFQVYKSPDLVLGKLIAGEVDIAGLPTNMASILYNKGVEIQLVSIIGWGVMYVVSTDSDLKSWKDLKGKEIYLSSKGAVSDILFQYLAGKNGLNAEQDFKIQYIASAVEIAQLAASGKVSTAVLPEPWVTEVLEKNPRMKIVLDCQKEWKRVERQTVTYPQTCVVVQKKFAREHPEVLKGFLKELDQSIQWLNHNSKAGGVLAEKYVQISATAVEKGLPRCNLKYASALKARLAVNRFLERLGEFSKESIGGKVPDEGFYYQP